MAKAYRKGFIFVQGNFAGTIKETDKGYEFTYDMEYLESANPLPVSLTMPLSMSPYTSNVLFPFFDGLIPEGWLLGLVTRNWKIDLSDRFGLLLTVCKDCIGDVSVKSEDEI
ncbi:MAG: HipA N-terminal domain-containing protein [Clostridia bacterium]|nr:HipA N-terminal domain-containing protein [Clostridia bacterium]MDO5303581.1 HipA N-terminal domain-containing protein [Clostridia bacterium]